MARKKKCERSVALFHIDDRSCYFFFVVPSSPQTEPNAQMRADAARAGNRRAERPPDSARVDGRRARGAATRRAILGRAMEIAGTDGLDGLTIGRLASELEMSKSGLFAHFDSKEQLQLATLRAARRVFADHAVFPAQSVPEGIERLWTLVGAWLEYLGREVPRGGCLFIESAAEFDGRPGPVRDLIAETMGLWLQLLADQAASALSQCWMHGVGDMSPAASWSPRAFISFS